MTEIKFDRRNYRKHNDRNKALLKKSLEECSAGRSIVTDNTGEIIAGNGIYEQAQALNMPVKVVETDGSELIVVKRTDLSADDEKRKRLAVLDNSTSDTSEFDLDMLTEDFELDELKEIGFDEKKSALTKRILKSRVFSANLKTALLPTSSKTKARFSP